MKQIKKQNDAGLEFISKKPEKKNGNDIFIVRCKYCGKVFSIWATTYYQNKNTCECLSIDKRLYNIYYNMRTRCYNDKSIGYNNYMGRGINICDEWLNNYMSFQNWAITHGYKDGLSIDRIDNEKNYSPDNCRWVDNYDQANNKSNNIMFVVRQYKTSLRHLCECFNIGYKSSCDWFYKHNRNKNMFIDYLKRRTKFSDIEDFDYNRDHERELLPLSFVGETI